MFVQTRFLRRGGIAVENQRSKHHQSSGMLSLGRTVLLSYRISAARRSQPVSPGTRRIDRSAVATVRENPEVRMMCAEHFAFDDVYSCYYIFIVFYIYFKRCCTRSCRTVKHKRLTRIRFTVMVAWYTWLPR